MSEMKKKAPKKWPLKNAYWEAGDGSGGNAGLKADAEKQWAKFSGKNPCPAPIWHKFIVSVYDHDLEHFLIVCKLCPVCVWVKKERNIS